MIYASSFRLKTLRQIAGKKGTACAQAVDNLWVEQGAV